MKKVKQSFMQGVLILMISQVIIKIVGLVYKIYLTNKQGFGDAGNAIYSAGFQIYTLFLAISSIGIPNTISQLISSKVAVGDNKGAYRIFKIAIAIFGGIGFAGTIILFFYAKKIANLYLGIPEAEMPIMALAPSVFIVGVASVFRGYFNGIEKISVTANSQSMEQIFKTILTIIVVETFSIISKSNTIIMVSASAICTTLSTFLNFCYLYLTYINSKKTIWKDVITSTLKEKESISQIIKSIMFLYIPMALTALMSSANRTIDAFSIINIVSKYMEPDVIKLQYGILTGKVEGLVILPYSFNIAFAISLIPTIAAANARGQMEVAKKRIKFSILATILISLPCMAIFIIYAEQILKLLFPNAYLGKTMLKICSLSIVFVAITQTICGILQGLKRVKEPVIAIGVGALVKLVCNLILLPIEELNINGAIIASLISNIVIFCISIYYLKKNISIEFNIIKFIIKPLIATLNMILVSWLFYNKVHLFSVNLSLICSLIIAVVIYIISIILLKILSKEEIYMLPYINRFYGKKTIKSSKIAT